MAPRRPADSKEATEGTDDTKVIPWHARQIFDYLSKRGASFSDQIQSDLVASKMGVSQLSTWRAPRDPAN